jgi:hypothetical protein
MEGSLGARGSTVALVAAAAARRSVEDRTNLRAIKEK